MPGTSTAAGFPPVVIRRWVGVAIVLFTIAGLEGLKALGWRVPNPPAVLILGVIFSAFAGGMAPGLISALLAWIYVAVHFSVTGQPSRFTGENLFRVLVWAGTFPLTAVLVGILYRRAVREGEAKEGHRAETVLQRIEQNRRLTMEHAIDAMAVVDAGGRIIDWNPAAESAFGWPRAEAIGRSLVETVAPPASRPELIRALAHLPEPASPHSRRRFETMALHRDGREFPAEMAIFTLATEGESISCAVMRDISERRAAERRHDLMMRELDHRVKNNLAAVLAIVDQTASRSDSLDEFMKIFRGRVMAMARLHNSLAASRWSGADLHSLVRQTLEPYTRDTQGRVVIRGSPVTLPSTAVSSVCMALHELATNASRFGALSVPEGRVLVEWATHASADGKEHLRLVWSEAGGPPVDAPTRYGFGRQLIEEGVAYEAGGQTNLVFSPAGVRCELVIPLTPALPEK